MSETNSQSLRHRSLSEPDKVIRRYATRTALIQDDRYSMLNPAVWQASQERQRALLRFLSRYSSKSLADLHVLEVGCGSGANLLELLRIGFSAANLVGNELLPERLKVARLNLPQATRLLGGDASQLPFDRSSFDIVYQSTVFSSLLDDGFQSQLARKMWAWLRPGGAVLWYDFTYNNPKNPDVRGVPVSRIRQLFPDGCIQFRRVTLAPPVSRPLCDLHPALYSILNAAPCLRTHVLCWIEKK